MPGSEEHYERLNDGGSFPPVLLTRALVEPRLSVLGRNPFTQAHVYTTATLANLQLLDLDVLSEFPHLQRQWDPVLGSASAPAAAAFCGRIAQPTLRSARHVRVTRIHPLYPPLHGVLILSALVDFDTPKCTPSNAWVDGGKRIGSLLRVAILSHNRIERMRDLSQSHQFLQELHLAYNGISIIEGVAQLRFLRVLDLSHNQLTSTRGLVVAATTNESPENKGLEALETLLLSHNKIEAVNEVASLPRLEHLNLTHNNMKQLSSIGVINFTPLSCHVFLLLGADIFVRVRLQSCERLQYLDISSNDLEDVNELNHLMPLRFLQCLALQGCPLIEHEGSQVFYRARVLRRLLQLQRLDDDNVTAKEKIKALMMHGSDVEARQRVFAKYLPGQQFANFLPPLEFEDDQVLERFSEQLGEKQQHRGFEVSAAAASEEAEASSS